MIKAIIFDMDDTLYPEYEYVLSGFKAVNDYLEQKNIFGFYKIAVQLFEKGERGKIFNDSLDILGISYNKEDILSLLKVYRNHKPTIKLFLDARHILDELSCKFPLGLISDGYLEAQQKKVEALKIEKYFAKIILTDEIGKDAWKPSPIAYEKMSDYFNVKHSEMIYIGDNASKDFITANKFGWTTVQIIRDSNEYKKIDVLPEYKAQFEVYSLTEVINIINLKNIGSV